MMWFTLGSYRVRIDKWASEIEKLTYLDKHDLGRLDLSTTAPQIYILEPFTLQFPSLIKPTDSE